MQKYFRFINRLEVYFIYLTGSGNCVCIKSQFNAVYNNKLFKQLSYHLDVENYKNILIF